MTMRLAALLVGVAHAQDAGPRGGSASSSSSPAAGSWEITTCDGVDPVLDAAKMQPAGVGAAYDEAASWTEVLVGDACEGTAVGDTCSDFACQAGYEGGQLVCGEDGEWDVEVCAAVVCTAPADTAGYEVSEEQLDATQTFNVTATCASGYNGTPAVAACSTAGGEYSLSGCTEEEEEEEEEPSWYPSPPPAPVESAPVAGAPPPSPPGCHVSDDLTCGGFMVVIFALILTAIAIVVFKKIMSPRTDFDEGRTLYNEDTPLSDSGLMDESADVEALDEYGDQDEHAEKKKTKRTGGSGKFTPVASEEEP